MRPPEIATVTFFRGAAPVASITVTCSKRMVCGTGCAKQGTAASNSSRRLEQLFNGRLQVLDLSLSDKGMHFFPAAVIQKQRRQRATPFRVNRVGEVIVVSRFL